MLLDSHKACNGREMIAMRNVVTFLLLFILIFSISACSDAKEINEWSYVYSIGIDKGVSNSLRYSFQIASMKMQGGGGDGSNGSGGGQSEDRSYSVYSVDAPTFYGAVSMAESSSSRFFNYMHTKYLVISEDLAREGIENFINSLIRNRQIRKILHILISRDGAEAFLEEFNPKLTAAISNAQEGFLDTSRESGLNLDATYHQFFTDMKTTYRMPVAPVVAINDGSNYLSSGTPSENFKSEGDYYAGELPRKGMNSFEFFGTALFDGDKMVGMLNGDETRGLLMIKNELKSAFISVPDPVNEGLNISIQTKLQKKTSIQVDVSGDKPVVDVKVSLEGDMLNVQGHGHYESPDMKPVLEDAFRLYIRELLIKTVDKCKTLKVDVFGFGDKAARHFSTIQEWEEYDWLNRFHEAEVNISVQFVIRRTGTLIKSNPTRASRGKG